MEILTERLRLRCMRPDDVPEVTRLLNDWSVVRWLARPPFPYTEAAAREFMAMFQQVHAGETVTGFLIADRAGDRALGSIGARVDEDWRGELGYWIGRPHWRQGYAREAAAALVAHFRGIPAIRALTARIDPDNEGSRRVLLGAGFVEHGREPLSEPSRAGSSDMLSSATRPGPPTRAMTAMDPARLVEVEDLRVQFDGRGGTVRAVDGVSWHVDRGETLAVVGESGSGKSVSALALMRLTELGGGRITGGSIRFRRRDGRVQELTEQPPAVLRAIRGDEISMIFQEPMTSLNPVLTIGRQIVEVVRLHRGQSEREAMATAKEMLELVRMPEAEKRLASYPHQLSGGMRQRAMIAMALACRPALLIADEPTTALDVTIQAQILDLIKLLQREIGMAVLFITHDMGVVAEMADRVVVMHRGRAVEQGTAEQIFHAPGHDYTRALLAAVPRLGGTTGPAPVASSPPTEGGAEAPTREPLLDVQDLTTRFYLGGGFLGRPRQAIHAVEGISFTLGAGETLALVGESGCGKSTAVRTVLRLQEPTRGSVVFAGKDITALDRAAMGPVRRQMQMVFQDPFASLNPRMTVRALVGEPLRIHGLANGDELRDRVAALLRRVGLEPAHGERYPHEFSGGQRQRICIARALALEPALVAADEAVSALDVSIQAQILDLLLELQAERGLAYLFVSHDLAVVERIAHRVAVMYLGRIVEIGPAAALLADPRHPYTKKLLAAVPIADPRRRRTERRLMTEEIPSPLRPFGWEPPPARMEEVEPGHWVMAD